MLQRIKTAWRAPGFARSSKWRAARAAWLRENPMCFACMGREKLEVHHKIPVHIAPDLELDPTNLVTLCESKKYGVNCHLFVGHLGNYRLRYNSNVAADALFVRERLTEGDLAQTR